MPGRCLDALMPQLVLRQAYVLLCQLGAYEAPEIVGLNAVADAFAHERLIAVDGTREVGSTNARMAPE